MHLQHGGWNTGGFFCCLFFFYIKRRSSNAPPCSAKIRARKFGSCLVYSLYSWKHETEVGLLERYPHTRFSVGNGGGSQPAPEKSILRFPSTLDFLVSWIMFTAFNDGYTPGYDDDGFFFLRISFTSRLDVGRRNSIREKENTGGARCWIYAQEMCFQDWSWHFPCANGRFTCI